MRNCANCGAPKAEPAAGWVRFAGMPRIALLTLEDRGDFVIDDAIAIDELTRRGWDASEVPWDRHGVDWSSYDLVVVRTTWDYHLRPQEFLDALARIEGSDTRLENPRALIAWNLDKRYLRDLARRGVPIVPSVWGDRSDADAFTTLFDTLGTDEIVVKPVVSANALDTFRLRAPLDAETLERLAATFTDRDWFAQPFLHSITTEGEYSVFCFHGAVSHAVRKVPAQGDFRVQEEHGADVVAQPITDEIRTATTRTLAALDAIPLQARVDLVRLADGSLALMELEMIEPSLYFRFDDRAAANFADAVAAIVPGAR